MKINEKQWNKIENNKNKWKNVQLNEHIIKLKENIKNKRTTIKIHVKQ